MLKTHVLSVHPVPPWSSAILDEVLHDLQSCRFQLFHLPSLSFCFFVVSISNSPCSLRLSDVSSLDPSMGIRWGCLRRLTYFGYKLEVGTEKTYLVCFYFESFETMECVRSRCVRMGGDRNGGGRTSWNGESKIRTLWFGFSNLLNQPFRKLKTCISMFHAAPHNRWLGSRRF